MYIAPSLSIAIAERAANGEPYQDIANYYGIDIKRVSYHALKHGIRRHAAHNRRPLVRKKPNSHRKSAPRLMAIIHADSATLELLRKLPGVRVTDVSEA